MIYFAIFYVAIALIVGHYVHKDIKSHSLDSEWELTIALSIFWLPILVMGLIVSGIQWVKERMESK